MPRNLGYVSKAKKYVKKQAKKRYRTRTGGMRINRLIKDVNTVKSMLNTEIKYVDINYSSSGSGQLSAISTAPDFKVIPYPQQGVTSKQTIGAQFKITNVSFKAHCILNDTASNILTNHPFRFMLVFQKTPQIIASGTQWVYVQPGIEDLFDPDMNGAYTQSSYRNRQELANYDVIYSKVINYPHKSNSLGTNATHSVYLSESIPIEKLVKFPNVAQDGYNFANNIRLANTNQLYAILQSNVDGSTQKTTMALQVRLSYVDN